MENLVPLGTGNSRLMKSNISPSTTLAQLISMLNNGTFPYDIGPLNQTGISQAGTPLNKDTLLKDTTAALFGQTDYSDVVPDTILAKLAKAVLFSSGKTTDVKGNPIVIAPQIETGSYVGTNTYGASNPNSISFSFAPKVIMLFNGYGEPVQVTEVGNKSLLAIGSTFSLSTSYSRGLFTSWAQDYNTYNDSYMYAKKSADGKTIYWYHAVDSVRQLNRSTWVNGGGQGGTYYYVAIG